MTICGDCGCNFFDLGNMPFCADCIERREKNVQVCGSALKSDFNEHQEKLSEFFNTKTADPWIHRSSEMKCRTCMWFVNKAVPTEAKTIGRCRRHAPSMNGYPVVFENDWCGDHKLDETKI